jgi:hypothetical protein
MAGGAFVASTIAGVITKHEAEDVPKYALSDVSSEIATSIASSIAPETLHALENIFGEGDLEGVVAASVRYLRKDTRLQGREKRRKFLSKTKEITFSTCFFCLSCVDEWKQVATRLSSCDLVLSICIPESK